MTKKELTKLRARDRYNYRKIHGSIPEGYTMHHLWYDESGYNEDSFVIITKEEHEKIHGHAIQASTGVTNSSWKKENAEHVKEYNKKCWENASEELRERNRERARKYYYENREKKLEYEKKKRELKKLLKES